MKTAKFGGTSLADAGRFLQVRDIILSDPEIRFVVVSAPGKRFKEDKKITDMLYACHDSVRHGVDAKHAFRQVADRFRQIVKELGLKIDLESEFKNVESDLEAGASIDYCASRGEYFSALIMSALLQWPLIDPAQCLFFDHNGGANLDMANRELKRVIGGSSCGVMPGFYGAMAGGGVRTFARGGSDISGALLANASGSDVYENWTDVPGIFNGDPSTVPDADVIPAMAYEEIRELAYMGANVLHEDAVFPARRMGIPIHMRYTMDPSAPGTDISAAPGGSPIPVTGISGRRGYATVQIEKESMNSTVGYCRRILSAFEKNGVPFDHIATGLGSVSLVAPVGSVEDCRDTLIADITAAVNPDSISIDKGLAMISVVGSDMAGKPGVAGRLLSAIGRAGINVRMIVQGTREINITVGVNEQDYEKAVRAAHSEFFRAEHTA